MVLSTKETALVLLNRPHRMAVFGDGKLHAEIFETKLSTESSLQVSLAIFELKKPIGCGTKVMVDAPNEIESGVAHFIFKNKESVEVMQAWLDGVKRRIDGKA